jgi:hypothetical protein
MHCATGASFSPSLQVTGKEGGMTWVRELAVKSGQIWFKPDDEGDIHTVEGLLQASEPVWIWFQDIDCSVSFPVPDPSRLYHVRGGRVTFESRLEPGSPQPSELLDVCLRLLTPDADQGEEWYGYVFSAQLSLETGEMLSLRFKDTTFWGREGTFVEFVRHEPPFVLVAHERASVVATKPEEFELMLRLKARWPLERE